MNKRSYWKEGFLLLLGIVIGFNVPRKVTEPTREIKIVRDTTIVDTILVKSKPVVLPLTKENVKKELLSQNIPHHKIVLSQSLLETGHYTSKLCKTHNNIFGIKKGNNYKYYNNWQECISDYKKRISNRYEGGDYYQFLVNIKYASDQLYIEKLKSIKV